MTIARMLLAAICALIAGVVVDGLKPAEDCQGCAVMAAAAATRR